jgi:hypothetical protein
VTTTTEKIAELKRMLSEATPGPWEQIRTGNGQRDRSVIRRDWTGGEYVCEAGGDRNLNDLPLIVAAVNSLPALLTDLEAAQKREQMLLAERERLREAMTGLLEYVPSDAQLVDGGVAATDTPRNRALLKAHTVLEAR